MSELTDVKTRWPRIVLGVSIGLGAGFLFAWLKTPLPWMIGPLVTVGLCNLFGAKLDILPYGRQVGQIFINTGVGLHFTPTVLVALLDSVGWIVGGGVAVMLIAASSALLLEKVSGIDRTSCFFATVPGGAAEMAMMAHRYGGSVPAVAVAQSIRVAMLVLIIPPVLTYAGFADIDRNAFRVQHPVIFDQFVILIAITAVLGAIFAKLKLQNPWTMGPLMGAAALTASGIDLSAVPREVMNVSQVALGMALGVRFEREFFLRHRFFVPYALINAAYLIVCCAALAFAIAWMSGLHFDTLLVAVAPGGIAEMAITAEALGLGVATVTAFQVVRIVLANFGSPLIFRAMNRLRGQPLEPPHKL